MDKILTGFAFQIVCLFFLFVWWRFKECRAEVDEEVGEGVGYALERLTDSCEAR